MAYGAASTKSCHKPPHRADGAKPWGQSQESVGSRAEGVAIGEVAVDGGADLELLGDLGDGVRPIAVRAALSYIRRASSTWRGPSFGF